MLGFDVIVHGNSGGAAPAALGQIVVDVTQDTVNLAAGDAVGAGIAGEMGGKPINLGRQVGRVSNAGKVPGQPLLDEAFDFGGAALAHGQPATKRRMAFFFGAFTVTGAAPASASRRSFSRRRARSRAVLASLAALAAASSFFISW